MIFVCAVFDTRYPDNPGVYAGGRAAAPAASVYNAAPGFALGMKACEAMMMDLTFVS
jgi:hypothetical protein